MASLPYRDVAIHDARLRRQEDGGCVYLLVHDDNAEPVGWVMVTARDREPSEWKDRFGCAEVEDLFVAVPARGRGFGRELMLAAEGVAFNLDLPCVGLATAAETDRDFVPARKLYTSLGYKDVSRGPWIESWAWTAESGERMAEYEVSSSYFVKRLPTP
jgi:GNAT superfamily N-acetyltransferase